MARNKFSVERPLTVDNINTLLHEGDLRTAVPATRTGVNLVSSNDTQIFEQPNGIVVRNATNAVNATNVNVTAQGSGNRRLLLSNETATGNQQPRLTDNAIRVNGNTLHAITFSGSLSGNATSATNATNAANATNVNITAQPSSAGIGEEQRFLITTSDTTHSTAGNRTLNRARQEIYVRGSRLFAGSFQSASDRRLKKDIKPYSSDKSVLNLEVKNFTWKESGESSFGFIAQEVRELFPEIVAGEENEKGNYLSIEESKLSYLLLVELQKMRKELDDLKNKISEGV